MSVAEAVSAHKRKQSFQETCGAENDNPSRRKHQKVDNHMRQAPYATRDQFWNTLSQVWLTSRALQEFDRRNAAQGHKQRCTLGSENLSCERPSVDTSNLSATSLKNLKRFAHGGGPSLADLINCSKSLRPSSETSSSITFSSTRMTFLSSAYDANFEQKCIDHGIHMFTGLGEEPENWRELHAKLAIRRPSLSPSRFSDEAFRRYCLAEERAGDKNDTIRESLPDILGEKRPDYHSASNVLFENMEAMVPKAFKIPKPDLYWGAQPVQIDRQVRRDLKTLIIPSTKDSNPAAPNFFLNLKGPDGTKAFNKRQACYVGAMGARAMQALQDYGQAESRYDRKAYALSSTYQGGELTLYSHHVAQPRHPDKPAEYHMAKLGVWQLMTSSQAFREGVAAFRNAMDFAQEQRNMLIDKANTVARTQSGDATMSMDKSDPLGKIASRRRWNTSIVDLVANSIISGSDRIEGFTPRVLTPPHFTSWNHHIGTLGPQLVLITCFVTLFGIVIWFHRQEMNQLKRLGGDFAE